MSRCQLAGDGALAPVSATRESTMSHIRYEIADATRRSLTGSGRAQAGRRYDIGERRTDREPDRSSGQAATAVATSLRKPYG